MRTVFKKKHFTKAERIFGRVLQESRIAFKTKVKIKGYEVDFLVGRYAIEIDGHEQKGEKNELLAKHGYTPIHLTNEEVYDKIKIEKLIKCL